MSNKPDMKIDTNNRKDKTKYDGPEKPDAYMGNDKQWVFRALVLAITSPKKVLTFWEFFALMSIILSGIQYVFFQYIEKNLIY